MLMADAVLLAAYRRYCGSNRLACSKGQRPLSAVLYSSLKPSELLQCLCDDESICYYYQSVRHEGISSGQECV